jgi:hypothetical protein
MVSERASENITGGSESESESLVYSGGQKSIGWVPNLRHRSNISIFLPSERYLGRKYLCVDSG